MARLGTQQHPYPPVPELDHHGLNGAQRREIGHGRFQGIRRGEPTVPSIIRIQDAGIKTPVVCEAVRPRAAMAPAAVGEVAEGQDDPSVRAVRIRILVQLWSISA